MDNHKSRKYYFHSSFYDDPKRDEILFELAHLSGLFSRGRKDYKFGVYSIKHIEEIKNLNFDNLSFLEKDKRYSDSKSD